MDFLLQFFFVLLSWSWMIKARRQLFSKSLSSYSLLFFNLFNSGVRPYRVLRGGVEPQGGREAEAKDQVQVWPLHEVGSR